MDADQAALGLLGIARRAGRAVIGARAVRAASAKGVLHLVVVARDAGHNAVARLGDPGSPVVRIGSRDELGSAVGRDVAAVVGITERALADRVRSLMAEPVE